MIIKINGNEVDFIYWSINPYPNDNDLYNLNSFKFEYKGKLCFHYFNEKLVKGLVFLFTPCIICGSNLYSVNTTRLRRIMENKCNDKLTCICRSCSAKNNIKKIDMEKRNQIRKENWNKKTPDEINKFSQAIREGRLRHANITQEKINHAIREYIDNEQPLSVIRDILGIAGKNAAKKILEDQGIAVRNYGEAKSLYMKNNPNKNPAKGLIARKKISEWLKNNPSNRGKNSKVEKEFFNKLQINYPNAKHHPYIGNKQYDIIIDDTYIEFDGVYWHGKIGNSYDFNQMSNMLNDDIKNKLIIDEKKTLYRIWSDVQFDDYTIKEIKEKAYLIIENGILVKDDRRFKDLIVTYEYISSMKEKYNKDFNSNIEMLILFIQTFYPFYWMENDEKLDDLIEKIKSSKAKELASTVRLGNDFLKSRFKSYYMASKGKKQSMVNAYNNPLELRKIVENRLGITYKEKWDLTPEVIRRGFISNYYSVSFFNPVNAYNIYNVIAKPGDKVLDMSCGFGGRMLGWHCFQNGGEYIGYEPNITTYNELVEFSKELGSNIRLYNSPFEYANEEKVDVCFSCPPYYDIEIYSKDSTQSVYGFKNFQKWIDGWMIPCIDKMKRMGDKVYLVVDERIYKAIGGEIVAKIKNKGSHFSGKKDNYEYLIKL